MKQESLYVFLGAILLLHIGLAVLNSKELLESPIYKLPAKTFWFLMIWFVPILGVILARKFLDFEKAPKNPSSLGLPEGTCGNVHNDD